MKRQRKSVGTRKDYETRGMRLRRTKPQATLPKRVYIVGSVREPPFRKKVLKTFHDKLVEIP